VPLLELSLGWTAKNEVIGLKQEWMGQDYDCLETGGIASWKTCLPLPGDIIGEYDPPSDDDEL